MVHVDFGDNKQREEGMQRVLESQEAELTAGLTGWLIRRGVAKTRRAAQIILIVIAVVCFGIAVYLFRPSGLNTPLPPGAQIIYPVGQPPRVEYH